MWVWRLLDYRATSVCERSWENVLARSPNPARSHTSGVVGLLDANALQLARKIRHELEVA